MRTKVIRNGLVIVILASAVLSLQSPDRDYLVPYAPYLRVGLQVGALAVLLPFMRIRLRSPSAKFLLGLWALLVLALVSATWSEHPKLVLQRTLLTLGTSISLAVVVLSDREPIVTANRIAQTLSCFGAIVSVLGLIVYAFGDIEQTAFGTIQSLEVGRLVIAQRLYGAPPFLRMSSLLANPNRLATMLMVTLTFTVYLSIAARRKAIWGVLAGVQGLALVLTFSRAGISGTLLSIGMLWCLSASDRGAGRRRIAVMVVLAGIVAMVLVVLAMSFPGSNRFSLLMNERDRLWSLLLQSIAGRPLSGVGFGVSYEAILEPQGIDVASHNAYLQILSEVGAFGLALFLVVALVPPLYAWYKLRSVAVPARYALAAALALVLALVPHQLFEGSLLRYGFITMIWTYVMALMVHPQLGAENSARRAS